jgi:hypothetical protein
VLAVRPVTLTMPVDIAIELRVVVGGPRSRLGRDPVAMHGRLVPTQTRRRASDDGGSAEIADALRR